MMKTSTKDKIRNWIKFEKSFAKNSFVPKEVQNQTGLIMILLSKGLIDQFDKFLYIQISCCLLFHANHKSPPCLKLDPFFCLKNSIVFLSEFRLFSLYFLDLNIQNLPFHSREKNFWRRVNHSLDLKWSREFVRKGVRSGGND